jgi:hypothetical protein
MGGTASTPLTKQMYEDAVTRLEASTEPTRIMMNLLFEYMIQELNIKDFYLLTSPDICSKYVIMLADKLNTVFLTLKLVPSQGKAGTILFRPIRQLEKPETVEEEKNRQSLCMFIAYFYIRIFQIYGALSLTLFSDVKSFVESGVLQASQEQLRYLSQAGIIGPVGEPYGRSAIRTTPDQEPTGPARTSLDGLLGNRLYGDRGDRYDRYDRERYIGRGGGPHDLLKGTPFEYMNQVIRPDEPTNTQDIIQEDGKRVELNLGFTIDTPRTSNTYFRIGNPGNQRGFRDGYLFIFEDKSTKIPHAIIQVKLTGQQYSDKYVLVFEGVRTKKIIPPARGEEIPYDYKLGNVIHKITLDTRGQVINEESPNIAIVLAKYINIIRSFVKASDTKQQEILRTIIDERGYDNSTYRGTQYPTQRPSGTSAPLSSLKFWSATDDRAPAHLRLKSTFTALTRTREIGSCVSRALRLLNALSGQTPVWKSSICDKKFLVAEGGIKRDGGVNPGEGLEGNAGLAALAELFFDTVTSNKVGVTEDTMNGINEYVMFLRTMNQVYGKTLEADAPDRDITVEGTLKDVKNKYLEDACKTIRSERIELDDVTTKEVWKNVQRLFIIQLNHSAKCGAVFKALFFFDKNKSGGKPYISLNPSLLSGGVPKLDQITRYARKILMEYYSSCETEFQKGVKTIVESKKPKAPPAAPGGPPGPAPGGPAPGGPAPGGPAPGPPRPALGPALGPAPGPVGPLKPVLRNNTAKKGSSNATIATKRVGFKGGSHKTRRRSQR